MLEEYVNRISGIKELRSVSSEGLSQVFIQFELEEDVDIKAQDVRDKVALAQRDLPQAAEAPIIEKIDPASLVRGTASLVRGTGVRGTGELKTLTPPPSVSRRAGELKRSTPPPGPSPASRAFLARSSHDAADSCPRGGWLPCHAP